MPRVKLNTPPTDALMALFLERKKALNLSNADMAAKLGKSESTYVRLAKNGTSKWELGDILKLARALGIEKDKIRSAI